MADWPWRDESHLAPRVPLRLWWLHGLSARYVHEEQLCVQQPDEEQLWKGPWLPWWGWGMAAGMGWAEQKVCKNTITLFGVVLVFLFLGTECVVSNVLFLPRGFCASAWISLPSYLMCCVVIIWYCKSSNLYVLGCYESLVSGGGGK